MGLGAAGPALRGPRPPRALADDDLRRGPTGDRVDRAAGAGPLTTAAFRAYITQLLGPTLRPGDLVILDNLSVHKDPVSAQLLAQRGATFLFLPPYSPDLNPIEQVFAKLKALVRGAAPRSREALWTYLGTALAQLSPAECRQYIRHCGYTAT